MKKKEYVMPLMEVEYMDTETILEVSGETEEQYAKESDFSDFDVDDEEDSEIYN